MNDNSNAKTQTAIGKQGKTQEKAKPPVNILLLTWLLAVCSMIGPFATDMYLPSFGELVSVFNVPMESVQQTLSSYLTGFAIMTLFYGTISDVCGRRPTMIGGFLLFACASVGAAMAKSLDVLIFFRFLQGLFAGCGMVVGLAVIRDFFGGNQAQRLMAYVAMVFGFGPAVAPLLGGYFAVHFGWQSHFISLAVISFVLAALCFFFLPESLPKDKRTAPKMTVLLSNYGHAVANKSFMAGNFALGLAFLGQGVYIAGAADWCVNVVGLRIDQFWMLFVPMTVGAMIGSAISPRLVARFSSPVTIRIGYGIMVIASCFSLYSLLFVPKIEMPLAILPMFTYTLGIGMIRPSMSLILMDCLPNSRGMASSLSNFVQTVLFALGSAVVVPFLYGSAARYECAIIGFAFISMSFWAVSSAMRYRKTQAAKQ